jgi:hypothetical protein
MFPAYVSSLNARIREARANVDVVVVLPARGAHEFIVDLRGYVEELIYVPTLEFDLQSAMYFGIFVIANFVYTTDRNGGPLHGWRASFQWRDISNG